MTDRLLLDTHIALWLDNGDAQLVPRTRELINGCWKDGGSILLSAVSVWELALLIQANRIVLDLAPEDWADRFAERAGFDIVPLTHTAAARAYRLDELAHRDPADRLLIATAIELEAALVTYDRRIGQFGERFGMSHGFRTAK